MNNRKSTSPAVRILLALTAVCAALLLIFLVGRYGWKLGGFRACESAGIEAVEVTDRQVKISGFYPGAFPEGFLGYYAEETAEKLYVGFRFSAAFGVFETGDFEITIPTEGEIREVIVKTRRDEYPIWTAGEELPTDGAGDRIPSSAEKPATLEAYATIIGEYYAVLSEGWDAAQVMDTGLNYMVADCHHGNPLEEIGYTVTDLDGDGIEELAIGSIAADDFFGKMIFSLYTLDEGGVPFLLFDGTERNRYYYAGGAHFANLGSAGWNESFVTTLKLEDKEMIDMTYTTEPADYVQMELTAFSQWVQ